MTDIRWSHSARRDYRNIIEWLADRNLAAADRIADAIERAVANLADMPQIGRIGRVPGTRELVVPRTPYVVIYQIDDTDDRILLLRMLHGAQKWPPTRL
jgi:toxin ParE1/3/4